MLEFLKNLAPVTIRPPGQDREFTTSFDGRLCRVISPTRGSWAASVEYHAGELRLAGPVAEHSAAALDFFFGHVPELDRAKVGTETLERAQFYQRPDLWIKPGIMPGIKPGIKPGAASGTVYRRYIPGLRKTLSFRFVQVERDLDLFFEWHHQPRVYDLWDLNRPKPELKTYLEKGLADTHQIPLVMELDGEPVGYFEVYWAAQDRLAPYYDVEPRDRGFHFLIGNPAYLGVENTGAAVRSVMHLIYLDDARTERVVAEPRADNQRVLKYVKLVPGWRFIKEFDFPHKRAALLMAKRDDFFGGRAL